MVEKIAVFKIEKEDVDLIEEKVNKFLVENVHEIRDIEIKELKENILVFIGYKEQSE